MGTEELGSKARGDRAEQSESGPQWGRGPRLALVDPSFLGCGSSGVVLQPLPKVLAKFGTNSRLFGG